MIRQAALMIAFVVFQITTVHAAPDVDQDGIADAQDRCPKSNPSASIDSSGCEFDRDGDGVVDSLDQCPQTITGSPVSIQGCNLDSDKDKVADFRDQCPHTTTGTKIDAHGCELGDQMQLPGLAFAKGSSTINNRAKSILRKAAQTLFLYPDLGVEVAGYTDSRGNENNNRKLSQERAKAVRTYLISLGLPANRLTARGYGEANPIANNQTESGRAINRRVVLLLKG